MFGTEIVALAQANGWEETGPGANHPIVLKRKGSRPVPVRANLENRFEVQAILKQLGVSREFWPNKLK